MILPALPRVVSSNVSTSLKQGCGELPLKRQNNCSKQCKLVPTCKNGAPSQKTVVLRCLLGTSQTLNILHPKMQAAHSFRMLNGERQPQISSGSHRADQSIQRAFSIVEKQSPCSEEADSRQSGLSRSGKCFSSHIKNSPFASSAATARFCGDNVSSITNAAR